MRDFNVFYDDDQDEDDIYQGDLVEPKYPLALSTFLFETSFVEKIEIFKLTETEHDIEIDEMQLRYEKRNHSMKVYRLDGTSIYRVYVNYNMKIPHVIDIIKHPVLGWVVAEFELSSDTVKQIGNIIDQHLYN